MVEPAGALPGEAETSLSDSRAQFVASLGRRLEALREALTALQQSPRSAAHRDNLRRRIHAFGAASGVLGFDRVFEAFREAEAVLGRTGPAALGAPEIALIARTLDLVPSLVLGAAAPAQRPREERRGGAYPTSVLVFGAAPLAESLEAAAAAGTILLECERTESTEYAEEFVRVTAPDVAVIDSDRPGARELMETLAYDPLLDPVRVIAVGTFDRPEAAANLVSLGVARVLPKPVSPDALKRSVLEVSRERAAPPERIEPIGEATVETLAERLAQEVRRGLLDAVRPEGRTHPVNLGDGTDVLAAVWASVARIRELVTLRSGGQVRFDANGPEGAVPLAPWMSEDRPRGAKGSERRSSDGVSLKGRTIVVVDDDPSVVWFLSGLLRATGAEVLEAHDGTRALALVRERWPDLVVSDILMPGLDGFSLCREIKRDVALADVPVILLSWKEDLLQRARELGADADGYLRKEATASVVVQRAREVLLPRARVEARVTAGGEVRGRLDGLTPRLILEIACRHGRNAHVSIRDAAFLYEVAVRDGQVRSATRTAADGKSDSGERALSALLGVRAGRFAVRPDDTEIASEWSRELRELLRNPVERARGVQSLLAKIERVARVDLDVSSLEPYLAVSPESARAVVRRLAEGEAPAAILASGVPLHVFESVLVDAILHGAVTRVTGATGEDLTNAGKSSPKLTAAVVAPAPPGFVPPAAKLPPVASPAPEVKPITPPPPAPADPLGATALLEAAAAPVAKPAEPAVPAAPSNVLVTERRDPSDRPLAEPSAPKERSSTEEFTSFFLDSVAPPGPGTASPRPSATQEETPRPPGMKGQAPPTSAPAEPSPLETALLSLPAPAARPRSGEWKAAAPSPKFEPPRPAKTELSAGKPEDAPAASALPATVKEGRSDKPPAVMQPSVPPSTVQEGSSASPAASLLPSTKKEGSGRAPAPEKVDPGATPIDLGAAVITALGVEEPAPPRTPSEPPPKRSPSDPPPPTRPERGASGAPATPTIIVQPEPRREAPQTLPPKGLARKAQAAATTVPPKSAPAPTPGKTEDRGLGGFLVVAVLAAVSVYALITAILGGKPAPAAAPSAAPPVVAPAAAPAMTLGGPVELDLPEGVTVESGKGLLEVEAPATADVVVDSVVVGKGPLQRLPIAPGPHQVVVRGEGFNLTATATVREARRAHLGTTSTP